MTSVLLDQRRLGPTIRPPSRRPVARTRRHVSPATRAALGRARTTPIDLGEHVGVGVATPPHGTRDAGDHPIVLHPVDPALEAVLEAPVVVPSHPALQQLGPAAQRYLRLVRARRRRYLTRRFATCALLVGSVASAAAFATTDTRLPGATAAAAKAGPQTGVAERSDALAVAGGGAASRAAATGSTKRRTPVAASAPRTSVAGTGSEPVRPVFAGAFARDDARFVAYPANPDHPFLVCTRRHESDTAGGYRAVSRRGTFRGAYQFRRSTWNTVARHVQRFDLVGVDPAAAAPADQDWMALYLYRWLGASHWEGRCAGL